MTVKQLKEEIEIKDKFIALLAHDLRNPIGLLKNYSNLLLQEVNNYSNKELIEKLGFINELSNNTFNLLDKLILWLKVNNGNITYNGTLCDLNTIINDVILSIKNQAKVKDISIDVSMQEDFEIYTDSNILGTILRNLLTNAVKYSFEGGKINLNCIKKEENLIIQVKDNGIGIDQDKLDSILNTGKYSDSKTGTKGEVGTGIGLNLCKTLVAELNGSLWGKGIVNKGTTMWISIPLSIER